MSITRNIVARTLIWLAALTVPVQGLAAASCGCTGGKAHSEAKPSTGGGCSTRKASDSPLCCGERRQDAGQSCCGNSTCQCGLSCRCGETKQQQPVTPPAEQNQSEKVANDSLATASIATACPTQTTRRHEDASADANALAALDRCVSLCRFTL